jgi:hypothetical protein
MLFANFPAIVAEMQTLSGTESIIDIKLINCISITGPDVTRILTELDQAIGGTLRNH